MWSSNLWLEALWMVSCLLLLHWLISDLSKILIFFLLTLFNSSKFAKSLHKSTSKRKSLLWRYFRVFINIFENKTNQCYLLVVPIQYISFFFFFPLKRTCLHHNSHETTIWFGEGRRLHSEKLFLTCLKAEYWDLCEEEGTSDVSGVSVQLPQRQQRPCCALWLNRGNWTPCRSTWRN